MSGEQLGIHNQGNWSPAKNGGGVVSDQPGCGVGGSDDVAYYGGYLIAESMGSSNIPIVAAAPKMLKALVLVREYIRCFSSMAEEIKVIDEAIAAATTPLAQVQLSQVAAEPVVSYVDLGPADVFVIGDQYLFCGVWCDCAESIGLVRRDTWLAGTPCRRPVKKRVEQGSSPVAEPACETKSTKPPLGIKPERLWLESRRDDIYAAINRYREAGYSPPVQWLDELCAIEGTLQSESCVPF